MKQQNPSVTNGAAARDADAARIGALYQKGGCHAVEAARDFLEAGRQLQAKKDVTLRGEWLPWLQANKPALGFGTRTAQLLMNANTKWTSYLSQAGVVLDEERAIEICRQIWGNTTKKKTSLPVQAQGAAQLEPAETELAPEEECDESPTLRTQRSPFALLSAEKREAKKAKQVEAVDNTARVDNPLEKLFEPVLTHWPLDLSQELTAELVDIRRRHPEVKIERPLQEYRDAVRFYLISKATAEIGLLLEAKRGQPDYEKLAAETEFDDLTPLHVISRKLAPHGIEVGAIVAHAKTEVKVPAAVSERLRDTVLAALEAEVTGRD